MPSPVTTQPPLKGPNGIAFWPTASATLQDIARFQTQLPDPSRTHIPQDATLLKSARQRHVVKLSGLLDSGAPVVAKLFPLKNPVSRLKHKKYARREFDNYLRAKECGLRTPNCYAFFQKKNAGLVSGSGVLIEFMAGFEDLSQPPSYQAAAFDAIPALVSLFNAGAMHGDFRDENIFVRPKTDGKDHVIIDWQYAKFHTPKAKGLLEHLAAYFIRMAPETEKPALFENWLPRLFAAAEHPAELTDFVKDVQRVLHARPSVRQRMTLSLFR